MTQRPVAVPYDAAWPRLFAAESARLEVALAPWLVGGIHHIGSTSVPGMYAKPIVDMLAGVCDLEAARAAFEPLAALGYIYGEHRPDAHRLHKPGYHLHLTEPGSALWTERLAFRDALRAEPALADEYAQWKRANYGRPSRPGQISNGKWPFVSRVLARRGIELQPDERRLDPVEIERRRST